MWENGVVALAIIVVAGFNYVRHSPVLQTRVRNSSDQRYYYRAIDMAIRLSLGAACLVALGGGLLRIAGFDVGPSTSPLPPYAVDESCFRLACDYAESWLQACSAWLIWAGTKPMAVALTAYALGPAVSVLDDLIDPDGKRVNQAYLETVESEGHRFISTILDAMEQNRLLLFTLSNGQAHVGYPLDPPVPSAEVKWVRILHYISGYRDPEKQMQFVPDRNYTPLLDEVADLVDLKGDALRDALGATWLSKYPDIVNDAVQEDGFDESAIEPLLSMTIAVSEIVHVHPYTPLVRDWLVQHFDDVEP